ncbi:MAG TPA: NAD(P)H-hydrate dehydratase [Proteobacteria bacterium]|nr:NAD(P)H-hydrate dehydratase [Pseudomonadota bacterium]
MMDGSIKLLPAARMRALDERAIHEIGIPGVVLMEQAGRGAARLIEAAGWLQSFDDQVLLLAGKGNNGGDALVVARVLLLAGYRRLRVLLLAAAAAVGGDAKINLEAFRRLGGRVDEITDTQAWRARSGLFENSRLLVDGLLGTGLNSEVGGLYAEAIAAGNAFSGPVLALDMPSGLHADSGRPLGRALRATVTATFGFGKPGLFIYPGREYAGRVEIVDIGIPRIWAAAEPEAVTLLTAAYVGKLLPEPEENGHKGRRGHLLTLAGGPGKSGAGLLAAGAGLHCGCGLSTLALPATVAARLEGLNPALMLEALPEDAAGFPTPLPPARLERLVRGKSALAMGPGLGLGDEAAVLLAGLLRQSPLPAVLDADALTLLARSPEILPPARPRTILTPHPGEAARLLGSSASAVQNNRLAAVRELAAKFGLVVVLKGAGTLIAEAGGGLAVNRSGNHLLATAGAGDLLTGMIGAFLAQGLSARAAAEAGVFLHGKIADELLAAGRHGGVTACELARALPVTLSGFLRERAKEAKKSVPEGFSAPGSSS